MAIVRHKRGATALLFDRLMTSEHAGDGIAPAALRPREVYDMAELRASVGEQLSWLLNTRVPLDYQAMEAHNRAGTRSTIDYGLPDLTVYPIGDAGGMARLAEHLAQTVRTYEPRLRTPRVKVFAGGERSDMLTIEVGGELRIGLVAEPVTFELPIHIEGPRGGH